MAQPAAVFTALADPTRRTILEELRSGGKTAGAIASRFQVSWPAISRHLRVLKASGLIWETRDGRTRFYELNQDALWPALNWLARFKAESGQASTSSAPGLSQSGREYTS